MVTVVPADEGWGQAFSDFGAGFTQGAMNRSDEKALQKAVSNLGPEASPRDILNAITGAKTYSPQAKQNMLKNYMGVAEFEQMQKRHQQAKELAEAKNEIEKAKALRTEQQKSLESQQKDIIIDQLNVPNEQKEALKKSLDLKSAQSLLKQQLKPQKGNKAEEKTLAAKSGLEIIDRMRELGKKGNLGRGSNIFKIFGGETAKDFGEYEQLGKSLIQLSTNIPIRNRQEFETLAHNLYDPTIPDSQREGILNALQMIISGPKNIGKQERPPLTSFMRE